MNNLNKYKGLIFDRLFNNLEHNEDKKEVILIYGPNATGKSTLFNFIIDLNSIYKKIIFLLLTSKNESKDKSWLEYFLEADDIYDDKLVEELNKILKENFDQNDQNIIDSIFLKIDKQQFLEFIIYKFRTDLISKIWEKENNVKIFKDIWKHYFEFCKIEFKQVNVGKSKELSEIEKIKISLVCLENSFNSCGRISIELFSKQIDVSHILKLLFKKWIKNNKKQIERKIKKKIECDGQKLYECICTLFKNEINMKIDAGDWQSLITSTTTNIFPYSFVNHIKNNNRNSNMYFSKAIIKKYLKFSDSFNNLIHKIDKIIFSSNPHLKNNLVKLKQFILTKMKQTSLFHKLIDNKNDIIHFIFEAKQSVSILMKNKNKKSLIDKINKILELMSELYKNQHNSQEVKNKILVLKEIIKEEDKEKEFSSVARKINKSINDLSLLKLFYSESEIGNEIGNSLNISDFLSNIKKIDDNLFNIDWLEYFQHDFVWWTILFILKEYIIIDENEWDLSLNSIIKSIEKLNNETFKNDFEELIKIYDDNDFKINNILLKFQNNFNINFNLRFLGIIDYKILGDKKLILEILKYKGQDFFITNKEIINESIYSTAEVNSILFLDFYLCSYLELNTNLNDSIVLIDDGGITFDNSKVFAFSIFIKELIQIGSKKSKFIIFSYDLNFFSLLRRFLEIDSSNETYKLLSYSMRKTRIINEGKDEVIIKPMQELDFIELFSIIKSDFNKINNSKSDPFFIKCKFNLIIIIIRKILSPFNENIKNITSKHLHSYFAETKSYKDVLESIQNALTGMGQSINVDYSDQSILEMSKDNYIDFFKHDLYVYINDKTNLEHFKNEQEINIFSLKINLCLGCRIMLEEKARKEISIIKNEHNREIEEKWRNLENENQNNPTKIVNTFLSETNKIPDDIREIYKACNYHLHYNPYLFFDASLETYMEWYRKIYEFSQDKK